MTIRGWSIAITALILVTGASAYGQEGGEAYEMPTTLQQCQSDIVGFMDLIQKHERLHALDDQAIANWKDIVTLKDESLSICMEVMPYCVELKENLEACQQGG